MSSPATMNGEQRVDEAAVGIGENVANLAYELVTLTELQAQLVMLDLREGGSRALKPAGFLAGGFAIVLGTMPVLILGLGGVLADQTKLSHPVGWLIVGAVTLIIGCLCMWGASIKLQKATQVLERSRVEFNENLRWIKKVLQRNLMAKTRM